MSDSVRPHRRQPTRLPCPWDSPGKNTGVGCHFLLQCTKVKSLSPVRLFATPWTAAHQASPSMGFSRQEYWSGVPSPSPVSLGSLKSERWNQSRMDGAVTAVPSGGHKGIWRYSSVFFLLSILRSPLHCLFSSLPRPAPTQSPPLEYKLHETRAFSPFAHCCISSV